MGEAEMYSVMEHIIERGQKRQTELRRRRLQVYQRELIFLV